MELRPLGHTDIRVSPIALGCWPLAGVTSGPMSDAEAAAVIDAALDAGINHLDTAHAYGRNGESERRIAQALGGRRDRIVLADKVGVYWKPDGTITTTGRPELLRKHFDESLVRLGLDYVDLLYFHAPADDAPIAESAGMFRDVLAEGKARAIGVSNLSVEQIEAFAAVCPPVACQFRYNLLQRDAENDILPWCREHGVAVVAYEPLALGLLTGKFAVDHAFAEDDWRRRSPLFTSPAWEANLAAVERLRPIAASIPCTVAQLAVAWTLAQSGVTAALCGAKRPEQIRDTAAVSETMLALAKTIPQGPAE